MGIKHSLTDFQSRYLVEVLQAAGGQAGHYHANESHSDLVLDYGVSGDLVTEQVETFLSGIGK